VIIVGLQLWEVEQEAAQVPEEEQEEVEQEVYQV